MLNLSKVTEDLLNRRAKRLEAILEPYAGSEFDVAVFESEPKLRQEKDNFFIDFIFEWKLVKAGMLPEPRDIGTWTVYKTSSFKK